MRNSATVQAALLLRTQCLSALVPQCLLLAILSWPVIAAEAPAATAAPLLDTDSYWRCFTVLRDPVVGTAGKAEVAPPDKRSGYRFNTALPPADWRKADFDDGEWMRTRGPFYFLKTASAPGGFGFRIPRQIALVCLRGRFDVADPAAAGDLALSADFRGGIAVYLNGREVARKHLPDGELTPETLAEDYPPEAYGTPEGKAIKAGFGEPAKYLDRLKLRVRRMENVVVPAKLLVKGENVLAVEIHRSAIMPGEPALKSPKDFGWTLFNTAGLNSLTLSRPGGAAAAGDAARSGGPELWNVSTLQGVYATDCGEPGAAVRPIRLVGAANGTYSGQVVVSGDGPLAGLSAKAGELKLEGGAGSIPASAVEVRYALSAGPRGREENYFDTLSPVPPAGEAAADNQPIWVTVRVPADAKPGKYAGTLSVKAGGRDWTVPVSLEVKAWRLPDAHDFATFADFIESPESVAMQYKVPFWSDEHFRKLETVFNQLGRAGNKTLYVPLVCRHNLGNAETMVRWIRNDGAGGVGRGSGEGGGAEPGAKGESPTPRPSPPAPFSYDFAPLEKYLDACIAGAGKPELVVLVIWDGFICGKSWGGEVTDKPIPVTLLDPATGKTSEMAGPKYSDEAAAEAFWRPVAEGIRKRLAARGIEKALCVGMSYDVQPAKSVFDVWSKVLPEARWFHQGHGKATGAQYRYSSTVWNVVAPDDPSKGRNHGWKRAGDYVCVANDRDIWKADYDYQLVLSRTIGEYNILGKQNGFGRMCADFWPVLSGKNSGGHVPPGNLSARYPESSWSQLNLRQIPYLGAGRDGALSTARYEAMIEGLQECEARAFIEKALLDEAARGKLGADLAGRAQALLDERARWLICLNLTRGAGNEFCSLAVNSWQSCSERLYAMAAEVAGRGISSRR